jgi:hypothetical protein
MRIIADDLHCTAVRISGGDPERISVAGRHAAEAGLEVWFSPFPCELTADQLRPYFADCAERAESLRGDGATVVLVTGCELTLFNHGFFPGADTYERIDNVMNGGTELWQTLPEVSARLSVLLTEVAEQARTVFGGRLAYASGPWEQLDWGPFDFVGIDAYRDAGNRDRFADELQSHFRHGKPVVVTEFGCCTYRGAADKGGTGWMVTDQSSTVDGRPTRLKARLERDEDEQARYATELFAVFEAAGVDSAFWFTFAGYEQPHRADPWTDLDLASYGTVALLEPPAQGTRYPGLPWEPKAVFDVIAGL